MELNLEREHINCYDMVLDTDVCQEETLEAIVPDACPDIAWIVDTGGQICLSGKHVRDGGLSVSGTVKAWVLYQPEGGQELCRVEVKLPFTVQAEAAQLHSQGQCMVTPCLRSVDARSLNPRKILVRADIGLGMQAYQPREFVLCCGISCDEDAGVQQRTAQHMAYLTQAVQEKEFTFYDEVRLSAGPGGRAQVLSVRVDPWCMESKVIGSKLIFKGEVALQVRYLVGGELCSMRCAMPFSQIMELEGAGEAADCEMAMCVTDVDWTVAGEDGRTLNVTLELLGQAVVRDRYPVTVLQDTYSTVYQMTIQQENCVLNQLLDFGVRPQSVRELMETEAPAKTVVDAAVSVSHLKQSRQDNQQVLTAELRMNVLYLDEQDIPRSLSRNLTVSGRLDLPGNGECRCSCRCPGEVFAVPAAGGVEVRFNPEFYCLVTRQQTVPVVSGARFGQMHGERQGEQPSVVLRMAAPGEELWDIAKSCSTTQERIRQANQLDEDELPVGQMLLIPSAR